MSDLSRSRSPALVAALLLSALLAASPIQAATLVASCTPATLIRGEIVRCTAHIEPPPSYYTVVYRSAKVDDHLRTEKLNETHAGNKSSSWEGPAVTSTEVMFVARVVKTELHARASFQVRPRSFPQAQLEAENVACEIDEQASVLADPPPLASDSPGDQPVPAPRALSRAQLTLSAPEFLLVDRGPNTYWYFVRAPSPRPASLHILLTRALETTDAFFQAQHGDRSLLLHRPGPLPSCLAIDAAQIGEELRETEGCAGNNPSSRVEKLRRAIASAPDVNQIFEAMTLPLDDVNAAQNPFVQLLQAKLKELSSALLASSQPPPVRIACKLRYP